MKEGQEKIMGFTTWHNYGYGVRTDNLKIKSVESVAKLVALAPKLQKEIQSYFHECEVSEPEIEDYFEFVEDENNGIASLLKLVIEETEKLNLTACDDYEGRRYLLYQPSYPWEYSKTDLYLTEEKLNELYKKYLSVVTTDEFSTDYMEIENGDL